MSYCPHCGGAVAAGTKFCPRCGKALSSAAAEPPRATSAPPQSTVVARPSRSTYFIWVPIALAGIALLAWAVLGGMPFRSRAPERQQPKYEVINESEARSTTTVSEIRGPSEVAPSDEPPPEPAPVQQVVPAPQRQRPEVARRSPKPQAKKAVARGGEISESEAMQTLRGYITSRGDYRVSAQCLNVSSEGYKNVGYTLSAYDRCSERSVGRWRVDSKTREVFRQRADGRFLRP